MKSDVKNESILTLSWLFYYFIKIRKYHILLFIYQPYGWDLGLGMQKGKTHQNLHFRNIVVMINNRYLPVEIGFAKFLSILISVNVSWWFLI